MSDVDPTTRAWVYNSKGYPECLKLGKLSIPTVPPSPHHVIIRIAAAALNPVDIQLMNLALWGLPIPLGPIPTVRNGKMPIGEDFAGTVLAVGPEVKDVKLGDHVFGLGMTIAGSSGTLQDIAVIDIRSAVISYKPKHWSWAQAAALPLVWLTARTVIESVAPAVEAGMSSSSVMDNKNNRLVVLGGSSAVGMYVVHQAQQRGWQVLATCSARNADFVRSMGADMIIDYTSEDVHQGVDTWKPAAVVDCVGGTDCLTAAPRYVTIVGDKTSRANMGGNAIYLYNPQMVLRWALGRLGLGVRYDCVNLEFRKDWLDEALTLSDEKIIVDSEYSMDAVHEAFERLNTGRCRGKVVVKVAD